MKPQCELDQGEGFRQAQGGQVQIPQARKLHPALTTAANTLLGPVKRCPGMHDVALVTCSEERLPPEHDIRTQRPSQVFSLLMALDDTRDPRDLQGTFWNLDPHLLGVPKGLFLVDAQRALILGRYDLR